MGKLLRFLDPKREKFYSKTSENVKNELYRNIADNNNGIYYDDVSTALARTIYECFYQLHTMGTNPGIISSEINWLQKTLKENLPKVKKNIWRWDREDNA